MSLIVLEPGIERASSMPAGAHAVSAPAGAADCSLLLGNAGWHRPTRAPEITSGPAFGRGRQMSAALFMGWSLKTSCESFVMEIHRDQSKLCAARVRNLASVD